MGDTASGLASVAAGTVHAITATDSAGLHRRHGPPADFQTGTFIDDLGETDQVQSDYVGMIRAARICHTQTATAQGPTRPG